MGPLATSIYDALDPTQTPRQPLARLGPSPRASFAATDFAGNASNASNAPFELRGHQDSTVFPLEVPKTAHIPPLTWTSPIVGPDPRRTSMRDAALDVMQSTYPTPVNQLPYGISPAQHGFRQQQQQHYPSFSFEPVAASPQQQTALPTQLSVQQEAPPQVRAPIPPNPIVSGQTDETIYRIRKRTGEEGASFDKGGFVIRKDVGYVCVTCGRICPKPSEHRTRAGGAGCVDFSVEYRSMQPWRSFGGEGMQVCQGFAEDEEQWYMEAMAGLQQQPQATMRDAAPAQDAKGQRNKGKAAVRNENWYRVGSREANLTALRTLEAHVRLRNEMQETAAAADADQDLTGGAEAGRTVSEAGGLFF